MPGGGKCGAAVEAKPADKKDQRTRRCKNGTVALNAIGTPVGSEAAALGEQTVIVARDGRTSGPRLYIILYSLLEGVKVATKSFVF